MAIDRNKKIRSKIMTLQNKLRRMQKNSVNAVPKKLDSVLDGAREGHGRRNDGV